MKQITIDSLVSPEFVGYGDRGAIWHDGQLIWHDSLSAAPNPYQPHTGKPWALAYGWIAPGRYKWRYYTGSEKHSPCLLINEGGSVPTRNPNENHSSAFEATEVLIHCGETEDWRGSAACCTVAPSLWPSFIACFGPTDSGEIAIIDKRGAIQ